MPDDESHAVGPLVSEASPLRSLPANLGLKELILIDGIRLCAEMLEVSYLRLRHGALCHSINEGPVAHLFLDAFSFVDHAHRLIRLLRRLVSDFSIPLTDDLGTTPRIPAVGDFLSDATAVTALRDWMQHLSDRLDVLVSARKTMMGALTWVYFPPSGETYDVKTVVSGPAFRMQAIPGSMPIDLGNEATPPIDQITLTGVSSKQRKSTATGAAPFVEGTGSGSISVCISDVFRMAAVAIQELEDSLQYQFDGADRTGSDYTFTFSIQPQSGS